MNLVNNAFYAVLQKQKEAGTEMTPFEKLSPFYEPTVTVTTQSQSSPFPIQPGQVGSGGLSGWLQIIVGDNGNGIPQNIVDKIFQPFFTTKPTGQGTGLGLSLSYDIIKAHGAEIKVESEQGEGTTFIITLPGV